MNVVCQTSAPVPCLILAAVVRGGPCRSAGSSREKALLKLVQNTNRNAASGSLAAMAAIGRQRQSERQQTNSSDLQYGASEPPQRYAASVTTVPRPESVVQREVLLRLLGTEGAQCCLLVDHTRRQHCDACRRYYVVPWLQVGGCAPYLQL